MIIHKTKAILPTTPQTVYIYIYRNHAYSIHKDYNEIE